jgi:hypothetical protein
MPPEQKAAINRRTPKLGRSSRTGGVASLRQPRKAPLAIPIGLRSRPSGRSGGTPLLQLNLQLTFRPRGRPKKQEQETNSPKATRYTPVAAIYPRFGGCHLSPFPSASAAAAHDSTGRRRLQADVRRWVSQSRRKNTCTVPSAPRSQYLRWTGTSRPASNSVAKTSRSISAKSAKFLLAIDSNGIWSTPGFI